MESFKQALGVSAGVGGGLSLGVIAIILLVVFVVCGACGACMALGAFGNALDPAATGSIIKSLTTPAAAWYIVV